MAPETFPAQGADSNTYPMGADLVGGAYYGYAKAIWGADGTVKIVDDASGYRMPVSDPVVQTKQDAQTSLLTALAALVANVSSTVSPTAAGFLPLATRTTSLSSISGSVSAGEATDLKADDYGALWMQMAGALSSYVDSVTTVRGVPYGATPFHVHYNDTASRAAASAATVFDPPSGTKIVVTDISIASYDTTVGKVILYLGADADTTYTAGTDVPIAVASFAPSATVSPGLIQTFGTPVQALTADHQIKYQNTAAIDVDIILHGYTFTP